MQDLEILLEHNYAILFIAPPGWGKTRMLIEMISNSNRSWIFISPLRALANEFYQSVKQTIHKTYLVETKREFLQLEVKDFDFKLLIVTPEVFILDKIGRDVIFVWDEFHLNYYWGDTFRDCLSELYFNIATEMRPILKLTATMSEENLKRWQNECELNYEYFICINIANQCLKNRPQSYFYYPKNLRKLLFKNLETDLLIHDKGVTLLFCQYRQQVDRMVSYFQKNGIKVLSCKGGETKDFGKRLMEMPDVALVVATTAISHGVNLPPVHRVYFSYEIKNRDFWIQMVGRGGRRGEQFYVHTMDFEVECGRRFQSIVKTLLYFVRNKILRFLWLLKEL